MGNHLHRHAEILSAGNDSWPNLAQESWRIIGDYPFVKGIHTNSYRIAVSFCIPKTATASIEQADIVFLNGAFYMFGGYRDWFEDDNDVTKVIARLDGSTYTWSQA